MPRLLHYLRSKPLYRPTLHQLFFYDWSKTGQNKALEIVGEALTHFATITRMPEAEAQRLRERLEQMRLPEQEPRRDKSFPRERRYPLLRCPLRAIPSQPAWQVAFLALQEGTDLLLHFVWYQKRSAKRDVFNLLQPNLWSAPANHRQLAGYWGQNLLLTAVVEQPSLDQEAKEELAKQLVRPFSNPELDLTPISLKLNGPVTLYVPTRAFLNDQSAKGAVLFYDSRAAEKSKQANRFVLSEWPLLALYQSQIEQLASGYRQEIYPKLQTRNETLRKALETSFATHTKRRWFAFFSANDPANVQRTLRQLSEPQYHHLETISQAQRSAHNVHLSLNNLLRVIDNSSNLKQGQNHSDPSIIREQLTRHAQQYREQIESDMRSAQLLEERANRAITILQTEADTLGAGYDRMLNFVIGIVGTALAVGQLVDNGTAELLYHIFGIGILWEALGLPPLTEANKTFVLAGVRLFSMLLSMLIAYLLISLYLRLARK